MTEVAVGETYVFRCRESGSWAAALVTHVSPLGVPFGPFYGPFSSIDQAKLKRPTAQDEWQMRTLFGLTGILLGEWERSHSDIDVADFDLPPFNIGYTSQDNRVLLEIRDPEDVQKQVGEQWVEASEPWLATLPDGGVRGAKVVETLLERKFSNSSL